MVTDAHSGWNYLFPVDNVKFTLLSVTNVSGFQPSVSVQGIVRRFVVAEITLHDERTPDTYLSFFVVFCDGISVVTNKPKDL